MARLREEILFYQLDGLINQLGTYFSLKYPTKNFNQKNIENTFDANGNPTTESSNNNAPNLTLPINPLCETG